MVDPHLHWPFFDPRHRDLATGFANWVSATLTPYEADESGDGKTARQIFAALGRDGWLRSTARRLAVNQPQRSIVSTAVNAVELRKTVRNLASITIVARSIGIIRPT